MSTVSTSKIMSCNDIDEKTLTEIAATCRVSLARIEDVYSCTVLQVGMMAESTRQDGVYVIRIMMSLSSLVDLDLLSNALQLVVSRNAVLRTRIVDCAHGLVSVVIRNDFSTQRSSQDLAQYISNDNAQSFGLGTPLIYSAFVDQKWVWTAHHAISDLRCCRELIADVWQAYQGLTPKPRAAYKSFVEHCHAIDVSTADSFWSSRFQGPSAIFPTVERSYVAKATQQLNKEIELKGLGTSAFHVLIPSYIEAAWAWTTHIYTNSDSIVYGFALSGRTPALAGIETTLGPTLATIPVQVILQPDLTIEQLLKERSRDRRQAQSHPALQYGLANIRKVGEAARNASEFQTLLSIRTSSDSTYHESLVAVDSADDGHGPSSLVLTFGLTSKSIVVNARFDENVLSELQTHRILQQFEHVLQSIVQVPLQTKLDQLPLLNKCDLQQILKWNERIPDTVQESLHNLFSVQARKAPANRAVEAPDGSFSYAELDDLSDRLAHELRRRDVSVITSVPFIFHKSCWTVIGILAIMKVGAACVPIDPTHPRARQQAIVSICKAKTILVSSSCDPEVTDLAPDIFAVNAESLSTLPDMGAIGGTVSPDQAAYILFTSGSTGGPKGVVLDHQCLATSLTSVVTRLGCRRGFRMLQFSAFVWDMSILEIFGSLLFGGCICMPSEEVRNSSLAIFIDEKKIDWVAFTPSVLRIISPNEVRALQTVISAGEPVDASGYKTWGDKVRFVNAYGPTETFICTLADLMPKSSYPHTIGTAVGSATWIVDNENLNKLKPIGAVGELVIEGPGVARGYLDDEARTSASFIQPPDWAPIREDMSGPYRRFYRTGDLCRYNPDGTICFIGRRDHQVKLRGQRFEIGEVESVLLSCADVRSAFASIQSSDDGHKRLVAVLTLTDPRLPNATILKEISDESEKLMTEIVPTIRSYVEDRLPSYMIPTMWIVVEQFPRTISAKVDRAALITWLSTKGLPVGMTAYHTTSSHCITSPASAEEVILKTVWSSVLDVPERQIGRESSFVVLGGDSVSAMQVSSRCRRQGINVTAAALLRSPSLATTLVVCETAPTAENEMPPKLAEGRIGGKQPNDNANRLQSTPRALKSLRIPSATQLARRIPHLRATNIESVVPATDTQAFIVAVGEIGTHGFQNTWHIRASSDLDTELLQIACQDVIRHHPIMRTVFVQEGSTLLQVVLKDAPVRQVYFDTEATPKDTVPAAKMLPRFYLSSVAQRCNALRLEIHHALYDAMSLKTLLSDLSAAYMDGALSDAPRFSEWIIYDPATDLGKAQDYWRKLLSGSKMTSLAPPSLCNLYAPGDATTKFNVPVRCARTPYGTLASTVKAAWSLVLAHALGLEDAVFGEVNSNRNSTLPGVDDICGPCLALLPVKAYLDQGTSFSSVITQLQDQSTTNGPYQHLGFRSIFKHCSMWPSWTRFGSIMVFQNHRSAGSGGTIKLGQIDCILSATGTGGESADLWILVTPGNEILEFELFYATQKITQEQAEWITQCFAAVLERTSANLSQSIDQSKRDLFQTVGSYPTPVSSGPLEQSSNHPDGISTLAPQDMLDAVDEAWKDVGLVIEDRSKDCEVWDSGADLVTCLLLSEYYQYRGYDVSTQDIVNHPSRLAQARLLDTVKAQQREQEK